MNLDNASLRIFFFCLRCCLNSSVVDSPFMPIHQTVEKHGDAVQRLTEIVATRSRASVSEICRLMATDVASHVKAFLPGVDVPDEAKKAASLRRQWYRWSAGLHVPDLDDLGSLVRVARRAEWLPSRGEPLADAPRNVQALIADIDAAEDERRTLEVERALETQRLELTSIAKQLASISERMPQGLHDIGTVVHKLCAELIEEVGAKYPLGGSGALRSAGKAIALQWSVFADAIEADESETLSLEQALMELGSDECLLTQFEHRARELGLWPEDLRKLWRWVALGSALLDAEAPPERAKHERFVNLLRTFDSQQKSGLDLTKRKSRPPTSRANTARGPK